MSEWGNGKPGNYKHIITDAKKYVFYQSVSNWLCLEYVAYTNFVVMMTMLVVVTTTKIELVEASQDFLSNTMLTVPNSDIDRMQKH